MFIANQYAEWPFSGIRDCLLEVALQEAFEAASMACFVLSHFVTGVVDGVKSFCLCAFCNFHLAVACSAFCFGTLLKVGLGVPYALAEEFGEAAGVVSLLKGIALEGFCDFGIAFAVGLARHGEVHADLGAFAFEVSLQSVPDVLGATFGHADDVLGNVYACFVFLNFLELAGGSLALGALLGSGIAFVYIAAYGADKFLLPFFCGFY